MTGAAESEWTLMKLYAANLTQLREGRRWNKSQLARFACMDKSMVSRAENPEKDGRSVQLDTLVRFALALNVPVWTLLLPPAPTFRGDDE
jgi:transcriptional regulator with XRE-family HTH domain